MTITIRVEIIIENTIFMMKTLSEVGTERSYAMDQTDFQKVKIITPDNEMLETLFLGL